MRMRDFENWPEPAGRSPADISLKSRLRQCLARQRLPKNDGKSEELCLVRRLAGGEAAGRGQPFISCTDRAQFCLNFAST